MLRRQDSRHQSIRDKIYYHAASAYLQILKSSYLTDADRDKRVNKIKQIIGYLSVDALKEKQELESTLGADSKPDGSFDSNDALKPRFQ